MSRFFPRKDPSSTNSSTAVESSPHDHVASVLEEAKACAITSVLRAKALFEEAVNSTLEHVSPSSPLFVATILQAARFACNRLNDPDLALRYLGHRGRCPDHYNDKLAQSDLKVCVCGC